MFKRILVAIDGSDHAFRALEAGAELAKADGAELTVVTVAYIPPMYRVDIGAEIQESFRDAGHQLLAEAARKLRDLGVEATTRVLEGQRPGDAVAGFAVDGGFDLIVLGKYGLSDTRDRHLGGVSEAVLRRAVCSLMLIH